MAVVEEIDNRIDHLSKEELKEFTNNLKHSIAFSFDNKTKNQIKPIKLDFGAKKYGYIMDIENILSLYTTKPELDEVLLRDGYLIKLALYHDELTLVNPIGISNVL